MSKQKYEHINDYYKRHPDRFAEDYFGIKLFPYQKVFLRALAVANEWKETVLEVDKFVNVKDNNKLKFAQEYNCKWIGENKMKFENLVEGKSYKVAGVIDNAYMFHRDLKKLDEVTRGQKYIVVDGILCDKQGRPTDFTMLEVAHLEFIKWVEFVDYKQAFDAMMQGKKCSLYTEIFFIENGIMKSRNKYNVNEPRFLSLYMLEDKKWVILDD